MQNRHWPVIIEIWHRRVEVLGVIVHVASDNDMTTIYKENNTRVNSLLYIRT